MKRFQSIALWLGTLVVVAFALLFVEADLLWKVQQYSLFLNSSLFFKQQMVVSGGMLSYLGAFFTQFFYYPWMGVLLLCGWWLLLMWLTKRAFCIPDRWVVLTLIPIAILLINNMDLGYWIYNMKLRGYFYVPTIGTTAAIALLWGFRTLPQTLWLRIVYVVLVVLIGYPLMGVYALGAALLMAILTWRLTKNRMQNTMLSLAALLAILAIPLLYYRFVYYQTNLVNIYWTALPVFTISEEYPLYNIPYYLLAACLLTFVITFRKEWPEAPTRKNKKPILRWMMQGALLIALAYGVYHYWYKDDNFHHELRMQRCIEQADWEGVLKEGEKQQSEPTRAIVMMHNLALSRLGRQCDEMYHFRKGSKKCNTPLPVYMHNTTGRLIYYQYGVLNECHRMCMEQGVEFGWSVELLQYLTRCSLLSGETQAVRKYLSLFHQTLFYGGWADYINQLLTQPEQIAKDKEISYVTHMLHHQNRADSDNGYVERSLMTLLSMTDSDDPYFQEQAVLGAMWTRNPDDFWPRLTRYVELHPNGKIPRIFQEAAFLFGNLQQNDIIFRLPLDDSVKESFSAFMQQMKQYEGRRADQVRILMPTFGHTYYFEYFFLKDITYF
jgi:hypothetical protein